MGATLSWTITESDVSLSNNTSKVTVTLRIKATGSTHNGYKQSGCIKIDGTPYNFSHSFQQNTTTTLATKSKTVKHNADGSKSCKIHCSYNTGVSPGTLTKSTTKTLTKINRNVTVTLNANEGSVSPSTLTKTAGTALTLPIPTRAGYTFKGWCTSSNVVNQDLPSGAINYGTSYTGTSAITLYAMWSSNYTINYNSNGSNPSALGTTPSSSHDYLTPKTLTKNGFVREGYDFDGWMKTSTGITKDFNDGAQILGNLVLDDPSTSNSVTLYAKWVAKTYEISYDANGGSGSINSQTLSHYSQISLSNGSGFTAPSGYKLAGWATAPCGLNDTSNLAYAPGASFQDYKDTKLYAVWVNDYVPPKVSIQISRLDANGVSSLGGKTVKYIINYSRSRIYSNGNLSPGTGVNITITRNNGTLWTGSKTDDGVISNTIVSTTPESFVVTITDTTSGAPANLKTTTAAAEISYEPIESQPILSRIDIGRLSANPREGYFNFAWEGGYDGNEYSQVDTIEFYRDVTELNVDTGEEVVKDRELFKTYEYDNPSSQDYVEIQTEMTGLNPTFPLNTSNNITIKLKNSQTGNFESDFLSLGLIAYGSLVVHIPGDLGAVTLFGFTQKGETGLTVNKSSHFKENSAFDANVSVGGDISITGNLTLQNYIFNNFVIDQGIVNGWTYRKWNTGISECWGTATDSTPPNNSDAGGYRTAGVTPNNFPPDLFIETPIINVNIYANSLVLTPISMTDPSRTSAGKWAGYRVSTNAATRVKTFMFYCIGRWK